MAEQHSVDLPSKKSTLKKEMIDRLADTEAHFKHQQRGEPDLTHTEKADIASELLDRNPAKFLERFVNFLTLNDTEYFNDLRSDYMIDFFVKDIVSRFADKNQNIVKNRRYQAMQILVEKGNYFSEDEMKSRDPLLFEQMIGQYESESEQTERFQRDLDKSDLRFSNILLKHMDIQANKELYDRMKEREEEQEEEEESESEEEEEDIKDKSDDEDREDKGTSDNCKKMDVVGNEQEGISDLERNLLRNEFLSIMQERFLAGEDKDFDYKSVDTNTDYDSLDILSHDAEEKYFDSEQPHLHRRHMHRMVTDSASDSSLSECGGGDTDMTDSHIRHKIEALGLEDQEKKDRKEKNAKDSDGAMESDDCMKFEVSEGPSSEGKMGNEAIT